MISIFVVMTSRSPVTDLLDRLFVVDCGYSITVPVCEEPEFWFDSSSTSGLKFADGSKLTYPFTITVLLIAVSRHTFIFLSIALVVYLLID